MKKSSTQKNIWKNYGQKNLYWQWCKYSFNSHLLAWLDTKGKSSVRNICQNNRCVLEKNKSTTGKNYSLIVPKLLFKAAEYGDKTVKDIWKIAGEKLGIFLSVIINFANPVTIVLCGRLSRTGKYLIDSLSDKIKKRTFKSVVKACKNHNLKIYV